MLHAGSETLHAVYALHLHLFKDKLIVTIQNLIALNAISFPIERAGSYRLWDDNTLKSV